MELITQFVCMRKDIGVHGNLFGGIMMSAIDEAGAAYASAKCDSHRMVTVKISELTFEAPVKEGDIVRIFGEVEKVGTSSITLHISAKRHDVMTNQKTEVCKCDMVFVRIDNHGKPSPISQSAKEKIIKTL